MDIPEMAAMAAAGIFLIPCAVMDYRNQRISLRYLLMGVCIAAAAALVMLLIGVLTVGELFLSFLPGVFLLLISIGTEGKVGMGDGMVFLTIGMLTGCQETFIIMMISLIPAACHGCVLLLRKRAGRNSKMPWMPYVLFGYLVRAAVRIAEICL